MKNKKQDFIKDFVSQRLKENKHLFSMREYRYLKRNPMVAKKIYIIALKDYLSIEK